MDFTQRETGFLCGKYFVKIETLLPRNYGDKTQNTTHNPNELQGKHVDECLGMQLGMLREPGSFWTIIFPVL